MFTFSFSSAFAATDSEKATTLAEAKAVAEKIVADNYDAAMKLVLATNLGYTEADANEVAAAWAKIDVKADLLSEINKLYVAEAASLGKYNANANIYAAMVFQFVPTGTSAPAGGTLSYTDGAGNLIPVVEQLKNVIIAVDGLQAVLNMYNADREEALSALDKVNWNAYSTEVKTDDPDKRTYLEIAKDLIDEAKDDAEDLEVYKLSELDWTYPSWLAGRLAYNVKEAFVDVVVTAETVTVADTPYKTGLYLVNGVKTKDAVDADNAVNDATIAKQKAEAAAAYAQFIKARGTTYKTFADAWLKVVNVLAEEGMLTKTPAYDSTNGTLKHGDDSVISLPNTTYAAAVDEIEGLEAFAAKYKAERDATGALVRDAKDVDDIVAEYTAYKYGQTHKVSTTGYETYTTLAKAEDAIINATTNADAQKLAFAKEVAKAKLADDLEALEVEDNYYKLEADIIQKNYEAGLAKIDAATTPAKVETAYNAVVLTKNAKNMTAVDALCTFAAGSPEAVAEKAVNAYVAYANSDKTILDAAYIVGTASIRDEIKTVYGEAGARTAAERKAVAVDAAAVAAKLSTTGSLAAAKTAAEDAIKALPTTITVADKDAVVAAYNLAADYADMTGAGALTNQAKLDAAVTNLAEALKVDLSKKIAAVDKTDKVALRALADEIDAVNDVITEDLELADSYKVNTSVVEAALQTIRGKELAAVMATIGALPVNITEADKATVEAARAAYDAFVEDWTVYDDFDDYNAAAAVTNFRTLALAEATLGLNYDAEENAKAYVQDLKIAARSVKTSKGVKVTINADVQPLLDDGFTVEYKFYRSTKSNAKFGTAKVTKTENTYLNTAGKKGTKYYYKAKLVVKNAAGEVVATTPLTQCLYATRTF